MTEYLVDDIFRNYEFELIKSVVKIEIINQYITLNVITKLLFTWHRHQRVSYHL